MIEINNLTFAYERGKPILNGLNIHVPDGSIYGFLGMNGSGKTTSIRNILQLLKPQSGTIQVNGNEISNNSPSQRKHVGALIEAPSFYGHLDATDNLHIHSKFYGVGRNRIKEVLDIVGLTPHIKKKTRKYSTGMKQRLGVAIALLHDPKLLILDEPANGLDPKGIIEMRTTIQQLRDMGKTIMLSSHLLPEIEKVATHVGILHQGKMAFQGTIEELQNVKEKDLSLSLKVGQPQKAIEILAAGKSISKKHDLLSIEISKADDIPPIISKLVTAGVDIYEVKKVENNLEELFLTMTHEEKENAHSHA